MQITAKKHEHWSSRFVFVLAATSFSVGLGNVWKFPYIAGENGGGAFILVYVFSTFIIGMPLLIAELALGRRGQLSPPGSLRQIAISEKRHPKWSLVGYMALLSVFLISSYYCVIASQVVAYLFDALTGRLVNISPQQAVIHYQQLENSPIKLLLISAIYLSLVAFIVGRGLKGGIEKAVKILMPVLLVTLLILVGYSLLYGDTSGAFDFLFAADFTKISSKVVMMAVGQAFFSIGLAMACMMTYGAYLDKDVNIGRSSLIIVSADTLVALIAGLAIFPLVFKFNLQPSSGSGLIFITLPPAFGDMVGGMVFSLILFLLLTFAAVTTSIANIEPIVSWAEEHKGIHRKTSAFAVAFVTWILSMATVLSFSHWKTFYPLDSIEYFANMTVYNLLDFITSNVMLPLGGLLIAVFVGWFVNKESIRNEIKFKNKWVFELWYSITRYVVPVAIGAMLLSGIV